MVGVVRTTGDGVSGIGQLNDRNSIEGIASQWKDLLARASDTPEGIPNKHRPIYHVRLVEGDGGPSGSKGGTGGQTPIRPDKDSDLPAARWVDYGSQWTALTEGTPQNNDETLASLRAPLDAAQTLSNNWDRYDLGTIDWKAPPETLPPEIRNAIQFANSNPALLKAISDPSGKVTRESVGDFVGKAQADLSQADKDFAAWKKANPDAGPQATAIAQSVAIMAANNTLLGGQYSAADLANFAAGNPGLSPSLTGAAAMWSQSGMFYFVDQAGQNPLSNNDGLMNGGNLGAFLRKISPGSDGAAMDFLTMAAGRGAVPQVDVSKLDGDIFVHPENYTAEQKAAVLQLLQDTKVKYAIADDAGFIDIDTQKEDGVNTTWIKTGGDLDKKIAILQNDKDVTKFLEGRTVPALQAIVNADPAIKEAVYAGFEKYKSGATLTELLNRKDANGNPIPQPEAIAMFVSQGGFYQLATGENGKALPSLDLGAIAKKSGSYQQVLDYYKSNVVTANDLRTFASEDPVSAAALFAAEVEDYSSIIDPADVDDAGTLPENVSNVLLEKLTPENVDLLFGDGHGGIDDAKIKSFVDAAANQNPGLSKEDNELIAGATFNAVKSMILAIRHGVQASVAWKQITTGEAPQGGGGWSIKSIKDIYRVGALHGANSILGAIGLGLTKAGGGVHTPEEIAQTFFQALIPTGQAITSIGRATAYFVDKKLSAAETDRAVKIVDADGAARNVTHNRELLDGKKEIYDGLTLECTRAEHDVTRAKSLYDANPNDENRVQLRARKRPA